MLGGGDKNVGLTVAIVGIFIGAVVMVGVLVMVGVAVGVRVTASTLTGGEVASPVTWPLDS